MLFSYLFFPGELIRVLARVLDLRWWQIAALCVALMFPVAFVSGILFPTIAARVQVEVADRMNSTGIAALLNTTGAAIGPLVASFVCCRSLATKRVSFVALRVCFAEPLVTERAPWSLRRPVGIILIALWAVLFLVWCFFHMDVPRRTSHTRAAPTKGRPGPRAGARCETD